ncbi:MAG: hypothetical protein ACI84C_002852 [Flavobacteriales bacterium]|jgi:hypothetical protein
MTNFILQNPDIVFIHLPKTGGTSVRKAWGKNTGQFFGHIPERYGHLDTFAAIREPKDRFLSAFKMFKFGNDLAKDFYSKARLPDLTISDALDVLDNPWIGFDSSQRSLNWNLKHHILPQTHPFNCLHRAKNIFRFENLDSELSEYFLKLNAPLELEKLRSSLSPSLDEVWSDGDKERFRELFAEDYACLGYEANFEIKLISTKKVKKLRPVEISVYDIWSAYFSDAKIAIEEPGASLPNENSNLELFADEIIPGYPSSKAWAGRSKNLKEHFHNLQPDFAGASRLSHLLACIIVVLRRDKSCLRAKLLFWRIIDEQFEGIKSEISLRWLVAIADTIADFGRNSGECAVGMSASIYANSVKLHESELKLFFPKRPWPPNKRVSSGGKLFDGMLTFWIEKGDLIENMFSRSLRIADKEPAAGKVLREVIERLQIGPTVYRRFEGLAGKPPVPLLDDRAKDRVTQVLKRRL